MAMSFYMELYGTADCEPICPSQLLEGLPRLDTGDRVTLDKTVMFQEVTKAVQQLFIGCALEMDSLAAEFYQQSWSFVGKDYNEMLGDCIERGQLPVRFQQAVLSLAKKRRSRLVKELEACVCGVHGL